VDSWIVDLEKVPFILYCHWKIIIITGWFCG